MMGTKHFPSWLSGFGCYVKEESTKNFCQAQILAIKGVGGLSEQKICNEMFFSDNVNEVLKIGEKSYPHIC